MSSGFDASFARVKQLVADFRANENISSPIGWEKVVPQARDRMRENSHIVISLDRQIDALVYDLYALTPAEIQIVEGGAK